MMSTLVPQSRKSRVTDEDFPLSNHGANRTHNVKPAKKHCACQHEPVRIASPHHRHHAHDHFPGLVVWYLKEA